MALQYLLAPTFQFINTAGKPLSGGAYMEVYVHGTRTKYFCASDFDGTLHPFRIPLDSLGSNIVLADDTGSYDVYAYNRYGTLMMSRYNVKPGAGGGIGGTITSTDGSIDVHPTNYGVDLSVPEQQQSDWNESRTDRPSYIRNKPNILLKADRVSGAVPGNLAGLDANGNLVDSGKSYSDLEGTFKTRQTAKVSPTASGNTLSFIDTVSQDENGEITATKKTVTVDSTYSSAGTNPVNGKAVAAAIGGLDVSSVGGDGKYISAISETDGKISATATTMDTTPTANSTKAVTSDGIKTAISNSVDQTYSSTSTKAQSGVAVNEAFKTRETSSSDDSYTYLGMDKNYGGKEELYWKLVSFKTVIDYWTLQFEIDVSNGRKSNGSYDTEIYETKRLTICGMKPGTVYFANVLRYAAQGLDSSRGYGNNIYYEIDSSNLVTVYIKAANLANKLQICRLKDTINFKGISNITWHEPVGDAGTQPTNPVKFKEFFPAIASTLSNIGSDSVPVYVNRGKPVSCNSSNLKAGKDDDGNVIKNTYATKTELNAKGITVKEISGEQVICFE